MPKTRLTFASVAILWLAILWALSATPARGEAPPAPSAAPAEAAAVPGPNRRIKILPATDNSGFNLAKPLQNALGVLFQETGWFREVTLTQFSLPGFTEAEISRAHVQLQTEVLGFVYLEKERIAVFLFDVAHRGRFIVDSQTLMVPGNPMTSAWIESRLRTAFRNVANAYREGRFNPLPGSSVDNEKLAQEEADDARARSVEVRKFFRELTTLQERPYYLGATVGVVRMDPGVSSAGLSETGSTVNFGGLAGYRLAESWRLEGGIDVFSQLGIHVEGLYRFPLAQSYVSLWAGLGAERLMFTVAQNLSRASLPDGKILFGPQLQFRIPLLGTEIRGDLRVYLGGGTVIMSSYGFSCYL